MDVATCIERLETEGYCLVPGAFSAPQARACLDLVQEEAARQAAAGDLPPPPDHSTFVWNLQRVHPGFLDTLFSSRLLTEVLVHFLNDPWYRAIPADEPNYILRSFAGRTSRERMDLHIDSMVPYLSDQVFLVQASIMLEDHSHANGAMAVVPGSHLSNAYISQDAWERAVPVEGEAGDMILWDARIGHGAFANESGGTRWTMIASFCRWWIKQSFDITGTLPQEIYQRLTDSQRAVLGFCSIPYRDESQASHLKLGYSSLLPSVTDYQRRLGPADPVAPATDP